MTKDLYLAAGCFWGAEHYLKRIRGVVKTEAGYANGNISHPTYREVYTDSTGYAETVHVVYDPDILGLERLVQIYFMAIDPTSLRAATSARATARGSTTPTPPTFRASGGSTTAWPGRPRPRWPSRSSPSRISTAPRTTTRTTWTRIRRATATSPPP